MTRAVLDTSVIVSGTLGAGGIPDRILQAARMRRFTLATSEAIVAKVMRALDRDRVRRKYRITLEDVDRVGRLLDQTAERTPISVEVVGVATHPEDDVILATAVSADVDYLVTGDVQLQRLRAYRGVGG